MPPHKLPLFYRIQRAFGLVVSLFALGTAWTLQGASFSEDANGFVFIEAEDFDLNVTQDNGAWVFDNTPLDFDSFSGWGYMTATSSGGADPNTNPHLDYQVNFGAAGTFYIWVAGSDAGGKAVHVGLDGVAPASARNIGGPDGIFGARFGGQVRWTGTNNTGSGFNSKAFLTVPGAGVHTVNLFIDEAGLKVDWILLTTDPNFAPGPYPGPANLPAESVTPGAALAVALTQPAAGKAFGSNSVVELSAKPVTNGAAVSKIEFFARLGANGVDTKIGEADTLPYAVQWANPAPAQYAVRARVTDASLLTATSTPTLVTIGVPSSYVTPLRWATNGFDAGRGSFTRVNQNHAGGFDFDWRNFSQNGDGGGALGGQVVRSYSYAPFVGEPLERKVSLNDELWFSGNLWLTNINANNDTFIGYFDSTSSSFPRVGLKVREPTSSGGVWRFSVEPNGVKINSTLASGTPAYFELHWTPTGVGNGSGTFSGVVAGLSFSVDYSGAANATTFDTFGWLAPSQGDNDTNRVSYEYFDNLAYAVPSSQRLDIQPSSANQVVLHWAITNYALQYNAGRLGDTNWLNSPDAVTTTAGNYYVTNNTGGSNRWYRLKYTP